MSWPVWALLWPSSLVKGNMLQNSTINEIAFHTLGGDGDDCLFIHGFGSDRLSWLGNMVVLQRFIRIHSLDLPGHGESGTDVGNGSISALAHLVEMAIDKRKLKHLHIVAHSLGGGIAFVLANKRPDLVASLMLITPVGLGTGLDAGFLNAYPELQDIESIAMLLQMLVVKPQTIGKQITTRVLAQLEKPGSRDALRKIATELSANDKLLCEAVHKIAGADLPRSVIWGAQDRMNALSFSQLETFRGECHVINDTGHLPHIENAKLINTHLATFLNKVIRT